MTTNAQSARSRRWMFFHELDNCVLAPNRCWSYGRTQHLHPFQKLPEHGVVGEFCTIYRVTQPKYRGFVTEDGRTRKILIMIQVTAASGANGSRPARRHHA